MQSFPDELLALIREAVLAEGRAFVMIDSLHGYQLAMEEFGKYHVNIKNVVHFLSREGVTTLLTNEVEAIAGQHLPVTDLGVSYLADNILLLRFAESNGMLVKVVGCLKKRLGDFQPELRQLHITSQGVKVGEKLTRMRGILTGVPEVLAAT